MSGSSLDGLDIACCDFIVREESWSFVFHHAEMIPYDAEWQKKLSEVRDLNSKALWELHSAYGQYLGRMVKDFILKYQIEGVELVASHGHTVFHHPEKGYTVQIGNGADIAAACGLPVVSGLRSGDIAKGGQGAPIVPIGEKMLFQAYDGFLNIGGIANLSIREGELFIAWDVAAANQVLNALAAKAGKDFDSGGALAREGKVDYAVLDELDLIKFYLLYPPRSMDNAYIKEHYLPILAEMDAKDGLATFTEHLSTRIVKELIRFGAPPKNILVTGGGAFNSFLIEKIQQKLPESYVHVPNGALVEYKEALIMAFIGLLRYLGRDNVLSSVTGARGDSCSGALYLP